MICSRSLQAVVCHRPLSVDHSDSRLQHYSAHRRLSSMTSCACMNHRGQANGRGPQNELRHHQGIRCALDMRTVTHEARWTSFIRQMDFQDTDAVTPTPSIVDTHPRGPIRQPGTTQFTQFEGRLAGGQATTAPIWLALAVVSCAHTGRRRRCLSK